MCAQSKLIRAFALCLRLSIHWAVREISDETALSLCYAHKLYYTLLHFITIEPIKYSSICLRVCFLWQSNYCTYFIFVSLRLQKESSAGCAIQLVWYFHWGCIRLLLTQPYQYFHGYKQIPSLMFSGDRKNPARGSNVPVGDEACRVSHWSGGPEGWHFPVFTENQWSIIVLICHQESPRFSHTGNDGTKWRKVKIKKNN